MKLKFDVSRGEYTIIADILRQHLTFPCKVWVFGSRAKNQTKFNSDLDLALEADNKIDSKLLLTIRQAFTDARLAYKVDLLDMQAVEPYFQEIINQQKVIFPLINTSKIPKLRFSQFSGEWEAKKLGEALTIGSGRDYKHLSDGDIPVFGTGGYMTSVDDYLYDGESVCIGRKGTINNPIFLTGKFWTVDTLFYTHSFIDTIPKFIFLIFQRINWKLYNEASGVPSLSKNTIEKIKLILPSLGEQQKIASFLTSIDSKIEQFTKKVQLLKQYKQGLMQKRFRSMLDLISPGGAGRNRVMSKKDFINLKILLPSLGEQQKIASFLTSIDTKIEQINEQLTQSQQFKQGLLQQMFI